MSNAEKNAEHRLLRETQAAQALKEGLLAQTDDDEVIRDTIEGETNLHEILAVVMGNIREDEIMIAGLDEMIKVLGERRERFHERIERRRAAIERAMLIGEIPSLQLPDATLSLRSVPPKLEIGDESAIPAKFWKVQDPKIDKAALKAALKDGKEVPGAVLGNGGVTLSVRRK